MEFYLEQRLNIKIRFGKKQQHPFRRQAASIELTEIHRALTTDKAACKFWSCFYKFSDRPSN
jgi:hypothetical protein